MLIVLFIPLFIVALALRLIKQRTPKSLDKRHVVITGGSSGIGKSTAIQAARKGANVTIIARNLDRLSAAEKEIRGACIHKDQIITAVSVDVSNKTSIQKELTNVEEKVGPIYMLVNCAGMAICGKVEDFTEQDVKTLINANYLGTLYPIQSVVPRFKDRQEGIIVLTASQVALMGMYGYSIYASCKFALRGLAESLSMELKPYNVSVTLALPPDTDTPGYENENKTKPTETQLISEAGGLLKPEVVAEKLLKDALTQKFFSYVGLESYILTTLCVGMTPCADLLELMIQSVLLGPLRLIGAYYLRTFHSIIQRCHLQKQKEN
ncbi:3-ketodihydrosphingosine reductase [Tribolium castaneum]|uniref:3-dehydrosphinganine reductase n=1 Tax=Tribolium castaneum TaxID=7070 RepID=D6W737_TRICA|nr:PREDICTED: 3-ketodihydrosphingosine reductase [Tribolium castaneum]EFA11415.2 3-ketodihydrosphingosine reductase-like Protein [Tribolium castaneum]|eukprot:XP_972119.1 PREDICTED: 3-ketodihydrosphingosine reductase [Tribolium castaneum]